jgi:hypothetical protein
MSDPATRFAQGVREAGRRGGAARAVHVREGSGTGLILTAEGPTLGACVITARILWSRWEDGRGLGAGAVIAVLRGHRAERKVVVTTAIRADLYGRLLDRLRHAEQYSEAARLMVADAPELLEATKEQETTRSPLEARADAIVERLDAELRLPNA